MKKFLFTFVLLLGLNTLGLAQGQFSGSAGGNLPLTITGDHTWTGDQTMRSVTTVGDGTHAGYISLKEGTANTATTDYVGFQAPANVTSAFNFTLPAAPAGGVMRATNATPSVLSVSVADTYRTCSITVGTDDGSALTNANLGPQGRICFIPYAATIVEVTVAADGGTPNVIPAKNSAGSVSNLVSSALATAAAGGLACSKTAAVLGLDGATTCSATLQNTGLAAGDWIQLVSGTAGGAAKRMSIAVTWTVN